MDDVRIKEYMNETEPIVYELYSQKEIALSKDKEGIQLLSFPVNPKKPFVLVLAGGGYNAVALEEGIEVAKEINRLGYNAYVLKYRTAEENLLPKPMHDLAKAMQMIMDNPKQFQIENLSYAIAGFSSGGHMAGLWCSESMGYRKYGIPKPEALFGAYPLISISNIENMVKNGYGTMRNLFCADRTVRIICGSDYTEEILRKYDVDQNVDSSFPPCYLIHGENDTAVYFRHSVLFANALKEQGVPCKLRLLEGVGHAFGSGAGTAGEGWLREAIEFWHQKGEKHD